MEKLTDDQMREELLRAYKHNESARNMASCNRAYMGSLAIHSLTKILGGQTFKLIEAIEKASPTQLKAGMRYIETKGYRIAKATPKEVKRIKSVDPKTNPWGISAIGFEQAKDGSAMLYMVTGSGKHHSRIPKELVGLVGEWITEAQQ